MKSMQRLLLFLGAASFVLSNVSAQVSYTTAYFPSAGNPANVNPTQDFESLGWNQVLNSGLFTNQWSSDELIPFSFSFYGQPVSTFKVSANGVLNFNQTTNNPPGNNTSLPDPSFPDLSIACFWDEFTTNPPTNNNDYVYSRVFGPPPFRQLWIKWSSFEWGSADFAYVAIVLEETSNKIYLVDMYSSTNSSLTSTTVGLQENGANGVQAGNNIPLGAIGPGNSDNQYYEFTPFSLSPTDVKPVAILSPDEVGCNLNQEVISFQLANIGLNQASGINASFSIDGGAFSAQESIPGVLPPGDSMNYTFNAPGNLTGNGTHTITVALSLLGDGNLNNDTLTFSLENLPHITSFPYHETFENGDGGWKSSGINSSWDLGLPANDTINQAYSGTQAWITNASGNYNNNEQSAVTSPCFDLGAAGSDLWVIWQIWWESEYGWDGAVLQVSTDLGQSWENVGDIGSGVNWFNDTTINGIPGGQLSGWTGNDGTANGSSGWVNARHPLADNLIGQSAVRFRVAFGSDAVNTEDGFAFDDFIITSGPEINLGNNGFFCDGDLLIVGNPGQSYQWSTGDTTQSILLSNTTGTNIIDSLIIVTVTDTFGLTNTDSVKVSMNPPLTLSLTQQQNVDCFGDSSGAINVFITNGMSPYSFNWSNGATSQNLTNLSPGSYQLIGSDLNGCTDTLGPITITENPDIVLSATQNNINCFGDNNGSLQVNAIGGTGSFAYSWNNGANTSQISNLAAGPYQVTISDSLGCAKDTSFTIQEPLPLAVDQFEIGDVSCFGFMDGFINLSITGGTPTYSYSWNNGSNTANLSNLSTGDYYAEITDTNGCQFNTDTFTVSFIDSIPVAGFIATISGGTVMLNDTSSGANAYQWDFGDSTQSTLSNPTHSYASNGVYQIQQIISNACGNDTAVVEIDMMTVGIALELAPYRIDIYPNPASDQFFVEFSLSQAAQGSVRIFDLTGAKLLEQALAIQPGNRQERVDLPSNISQGVYLVEIDLGEMGQIYRRILVQ